MTASAAVATSAIHAASAAASTIGDGISSGVWSFLGGLVGAAVAVGLAIWQQRAQGQRERVKMAADSAGSHMASVAFDKYVQFCEGYSEAAGKAFETLLRHGPNEKILANASELYLLRRKWALWITSDTDKTLERFEQALREIGASAWYVQATRGEPEAEARGEHIKRMYERLAEVMGFPEWNGKKVSDELAQSALDALLRKVLGTEQFDVLRREVISRAVGEFRR